MSSCKTYNFDVKKKERNSETYILADLIFYLSFENPKTKVNQVHLKSLKKFDHYKT